MLLQNSGIQQVVARAVVRELSQKLNTKVSLGEVDYKLFNVLSLKDFYVEDQQKDTLLFVHEADAHFKFWQFFKGKIIFTSVDVDQMQGNLVVDKSGRSNLDFVIEAFQKPQKKEPSQVEYQIKNFKLHNSTFTYRNLKNFKQLPQGVFNGNNLRLNNLNAVISLDVLKKDTLSAEISKLRFTEQSGFELAGLAAKIYGSNKGLYLPELDLRLPNSQVLLEDIRLKYDSLAQFGKHPEMVRCSAPISPSYVALSDLKAFVPQFKNVTGVATLKGMLSGRISSIRLQQLEIKYGKSVLLNADMDVNGLPSLNDAFIYAQINQLYLQPAGVQDFVSQLAGKPVVLPRELNRLGLVKYKGNITGFLSNLVAYGSMNTNLGSVSTDIMLKLDNQMKDLSYNGTIKSGSFELGRLLNSKDLGKISFNFNTKGSKKEKSSLRGTITANVPELQFKKYAYRDIKFDGKYDGSGFDGRAEVEDENIHAHFNGVIDLTKKLPVYDFALKVINTNLNALHLTDNYPGALLSFNGETSMVGNSLDNINGYIGFDSIVFVNKNKTLNVDNIQIVSRVDKDITRLSILSDYVNGSLSGRFKYATIGNTMSGLLQDYLPSLAAESLKKSRRPNQVDVDLRIANTKEISDVLELPYALDGVSTVKGTINEESKRIDISGNIPVLKSSKQLIENINLHVGNANRQLQFTTRALLHEKNGVMNLFLTASAANDSVRAKVGWQNTQRITNAGEIQAVAGFRNERGRTAAGISVLPTQVIISDSIWDVHRCNIEYNADSTVQVHNFRMDNNNQQYINIDGVASASKNDSLLVTMNDLNLEFILNLLQLKSITIGGYVTGKATLFSLLKQPVYEANLSVRQVSLNHKHIGNATLYSTWDRKNNHVVANGIFVNDKKDTVAVADGVYVPKNDSLDFVFRANKLSVDFLGHYFAGVADNFKGNASGRIRMFGPSKILGFEGDALVTGGQATISMLGTTYFFNDSVHLTRKQISLRDINVYDQEGNPAKLTGWITHNGIFADMKYNMNMVGRNILAMNTQPGDNEYFYGKAYADGTVWIRGDEKVCNIIVPRAVSLPRTKCYVNMGGASTASENSFINFVDKTSSAQRKEPDKKPVSKLNVKVDLHMDVTPDADMELIIDPKGGDRITGRGSGNLRVEFDSYSPIKLYGKYTIDNGGYLFTLQNLIRKEFKIDKGSSITWTGDMFGAKVDITALYPTTASLKDLDLQGQNRASVPVNCVLKLSDDLMKPTIKFDVDLPQSEEAVKQRVRNLINTEEMMNRQIMYLMLFGKFFTPEYMKSTAVAANTIVPNEAISFGLSTLSSQINGLISRASSNFSVGFDFKPSDKVNNEYQVQTQLFYQPNNRLVVNGNFGYSNENANASTNNNKFIGDVDVEWLLNESGKLRFKAYNHTVDRYRLTTAKTTQGAGLLYKEDFSSVKDMFSYYWNWLTGRGKKKADEKSTK